MPMQIKRRIAGAQAAPPTLAEGQLCYNDPATVDTAIAHDDALYIGSEDTSAAPIVRTLVSATRQVELAGTQTITGTKTIAVSNLHVTGGSANNQILTLSNFTTGALAWTTAPSGGLLTVGTDGVTISGDGTSGNELEVISIPPHDFTITTRAALPDGSITTINITPVTQWDATTDWTLTNFAITRLDDGTY